MSKVIIDYEHDSADLQPIYIAVTNERHPGNAAWKPAYRDRIAGTLVIWAKFPEKSGMYNVWVRDRSGVRLVDKRVL